MQSSVLRCMTMKKKIVVVDDHDAVRELLCRYLERQPEYEVVGQAGTGLDAIRIFEKTSPNVAISELLLPELCGQEVISQVRRDFPEIRMVIFTGTSDTTMLANALRSEPDGIVHKSERLEILLVALRTVSVGGRFYSPKLNKSVDRSELGSAQALSAREIEVLQSIAGPNGADHAGYHSTRVSFDFPSRRMGRGRLGAVHDFSR